MTAGNYGIICKYCNPISKVYDGQEVAHDGTPPNTEHLVDKYVKVYACKSCKFHNDRLRERAAIESFASGQYTIKESVMFADDLLKELRKK